MHEPEALRRLAKLEKDIGEEKMKLMRGKKHFDEGELHERHECFNRDELGHCKNMREGDALYDDDPTNGKWNPILQDVNHPYKCPADLKSPVSESPFGRRDWTTNHGRSSAHDHVWRPEPTNSKFVQDTHFVCSPRSFVRPMRYAEYEYDGHRKKNVRATLSGNDIERVVKTGL